VDAVAKPPPDWDDSDKPKPPWWDDLAWWNVPDVPKPDWWDELAARIAADRNWYAKYAATEFARGNPYPLIGRVLGYPAEVAAIRQVLQTSKQTAADLRDLEKKLIAIAVDRMVDEDKLTQKAAIAKVSQGRKRSISHVKAAVAAHGKRRNYRA
jgi:CTP synthase (UTP-ammonia lyase)